MPEANISVSKVLFVVHWFEKMGGAVTRTINLIKNLYKYKIDVSMLTTYLSKEVHITLIRSNLPKVYIHKNKSRERMPTGLNVFSILSMTIAILKYLREHNCDTIYVRPNPEDMLACLFISILKKKPLIIELHHHLGTFEGHTVLRLYLKIIEKLMIIFSTKVVVNSWIFYRKLKSVYGERLGKNVFVVPNSIDLNVFHFYNNQLSNSVKSSKQIIGFIGTLKPDEDLLCLVKAAKIVLQTCRNLVFMIVGQDMGLKCKLESEIERLGLNDKFLLVDEKPFHEIPRILKTFSVFVAPRMDNERCTSYG